MIKAKLVRAYGYDYFKYGLTLFRPPVVFEAFYDYIDLVNESIDKNYIETLNLYTQVAKKGDKKPVDPARMDFDAQKYTEWLDSLGLLELWETMKKKL